MRRPVLDDEAGLLYEPMDEAASRRRPVRPEPIRRSGLLVPLFMGVFSLAIIFTLVALYSVTSEFRLGRAGSDVEEVTEPVAPPAEDAETARRRSPRRRPVNEAPPIPAAETPLIEEIAGSEEPEPEVAEIEPEPEPAAPARRPWSRNRERRRCGPLRPRGRQSPKVAQTLPPRREPVVREGGVRPGPGVMPPIPLELPRYRYPAAARGQGLDIDVRLDLLVDERGKVIEAVVREGDASGLGFNETALAAARRLTFQPATRGDQPVKMWTEMIFEFSEPSKSRPAVGALSARSLLFWSSSFNGIRHRPERRGCPLALLDEHIEGKYEILAKLREGGMGAIYKVRHRLLDEIRVVKVIRSAVAGHRRTRGSASCARPGPRSACAIPISPRSMTSRSPRTATPTSSWSSSTARRSRRSSTATARRRSP